MSKPTKAGTRRTTQQGRKSKNTFLTKSGQTIRINRNLKDRFLSVRENRALHRAERLAGMPKGRIKRFIYRLHPKRLYKYWFSREGAIMALKIVGLGIVASFILLFGVFAYIRKDLPNLNDVSAAKLGGSIRYYDKTGQTLLWEDYDAVKRIPVTDPNISKNLKDATIAIEDKNFFKHGGFDVKGILRAGLHDTVGIGGGGTQGGSTITQQLVKLSQNWTGNRTLTRKAKELVLSVELEREYSKEQILVGYLNAAPYGGIEYGAEAAAEDYFQKPAKDLTVEEAALLAAIPQSPTYYTPYQANFATSPNRQSLLVRQQYIIDQMVDQKMITPAQGAAAKKVDILAEVKPKSNDKFKNIQAPWFVLAAKQELEAKFTNATYNRGGWKVTTTLDMNLQTVAEQQVQKGLAEVQRQGGDTAAFVAEDVKTGQVVALVGGDNFFNPDHGQNNYAVDYRLPPGSSFKVYDYTALIENSTNAGAGSVLYDSKGPVLPGYPCRHPDLLPPNPNADCIYDYSRTFPGAETLRYAIGGSRNVPAVKAMSITGVNKTISVADALMNDPTAYQCYADDRLTVPNQCGTASAIGDGAYLTLANHVNGFAAVARNGLAMPQTFILSIEDSSNKIIDQWKQDKGTQVVRPDAAYIVGDMISDPNPSYFPSGNKPQRYNSPSGTWKFGVKTGTTNDNKDGWMMGFSSQYAAGVWVGYHNRQVSMSGAMETMTQPIWQGWMRAAHANLKPVDIQRPSDVQVLPAYVVRNHIGYGSIEPSSSTDLFPAWYKQPGKSVGSVQTIDIISNKLATDCTPVAARKSVNNADSNNFSIDIFVDKGGTTTTEKDDVHVCGEAQPSISIQNSPANCSGSCTIYVNVDQGAHPLSSDQYKGTINVVIGGQIIQSFEADSPQSNIPLTFSYNGTGPQQVTAQITDSVLYTATSGPTTIDFSSLASPPPPTPLTLSVSVSGNGFSKKTKFDWSGGSGSSYSVYNASTHTIYCSGASNCQVPFSIAPSGTQVYVQDNSDPSDKSATVGVP